MSGAIDEPYVIASLPKPFDAQHGRIQTGQVHSLNASRKRKRHEVAVGVDGEGVNIYNVQNQSTVSSYALPPQSFLAAPPCSIYCKRHKPLHPQRRTYLAVRNGNKNQSARLISITEDLGKPTNIDAEPRASTRQERKLRYENVAAIDVVPLSQGKTTGPAPVLVSYRNGSVDCISGDLSKVCWEHTADGAIEVEHTTLTDLDTARRGLLRGREDVLALFEPGTMHDSPSSAPPLLCQIIRQNERRQLRVYALRHTEEVPLGGHEASLGELVNYELSGKHVVDDFEYELHPGSGILYQRLGVRLMVYDLSGTVPRMSLELGKKPSQHVQSFIRLSAGAVVTVSQNRIAVYDTKFGSLLASSNNIPDKSSSTPRIVSNFADLGIVVALEDANLVAFQLGEALEDARKSRAQGPLLSEIIGKGKYANNLHQVDAFDGKEKKRQKWEAWAKEVNGLVTSRDVRGLERRIAKDLHLPSRANDTAINGAAEHEADATRETDEWELRPHHYDPQHVDRKKAIYILGKMFAWRVKINGSVVGQHHLELTIASRNILLWLALSGYLTAAELEQALPKSDALPRPPVVPGDIMSAISEADSTFDLLCSLLSLPAYWDLSEVIHALKVLINSLDDPSESASAPRLLMNGDITMLDGEAPEAHIEAEEAAALREVERVTNVLEAGLSTRTTAFRRCLERLQGFPHKQIVKTMNARMKQDEIIFFIHVLRLELANGGWTQMYNGSREDDIEQDRGTLEDAKDLAPSNQAIRTIATLLSCSVDAIGLSGWLVGQSGKGWNTEELVESMTHETSAVIEGIYHAENLDTIVREIEKTAGAATTHKRKHEEVEWTPEQTLMPVGGRAEPLLFDGGKRRALMAEQKSRNLGKYSFERIRI